MDRRHALKVRRKLLQARFDEHREVLRKHKEKGPLFAAAVERLERVLGK